MKNSKKVVGEGWEDFATRKDRLAREHNKDPVLWAREALYGQILHSYELTMQQGQRQDDAGCSLSDEDAPPERNYAPLVEDFDPEDDLPFDCGPSM